MSDRERTRRGADVAIVGGGIVGCACAYELAKRGATVLLFEYGKVGMQATNAAAGMLAPLTETHVPGPMLPFGMRALREYPRLVAELQEQCGFDIELRLDGILKVAFTSDQTDVLRRRFAWQREMGFSLDWLDSALCRELEPRLSERVVAGVFSRSEGKVSNQLVTLALSRAASARGAVIHERAPVRGFTKHGGRVVAVCADDARYGCDVVVLAAGARSGQIARRVGASLPVRPIRGQMIALGGMSTPVRHIVWGPEGYLVPRANGLIFAGSTVEDVGFRRRTTVAGIKRIRSMVRRLVPQLAAARMHFQWAGLRPGTTDDLPIIGPVPSPANVIAATGHYRDGIMMGPLTGKLVAEGILDGDWSSVPQEFAPDRFAERPAASALAAR